MQRRRGVSLAKGPIALVGLLGIVYGLSAVIVRAHGFALHFPNGHVHGPLWLHLKVNGWTALLFIAAGLALLFSAAAHVTAKAMAMIVGVVMIALAVIGFAQKHGALGIFAASHWTEAVWAAAGIVLLVLALLPRVGGAAGAAPIARTSADPAGGTVTRERVVREEPVAREETNAGEGPVAREANAGEGRAVDGGATGAGEPAAAGQTTPPTAGQTTPAARDQPFISRQAVPRRDDEA